MAWLEQTVAGHFHVAFRFGEQKYKKSLGTKDEKTADARLHRLKENIGLVESGRLTIPDDADVASFLLSDGQLSSGPQKKSTFRTLSKLCDAFLGSIPDGALEENTLYGMKIHIKHLKRVLRASRAYRSIGLTELQGYIDSRSKERGLRGRKVSPVTIKKELRTLRSMWNWARTAGHVGTALPSKGLRYQKTSEKPPFQTYEEIERKIGRGSLSDAEIADLWDCLFLTVPEIDELLTHVQRNARHPFIYPMIVFAAHTGARRSELLRSHIDDIDLAGGTVVIREKKRVPGKLTTRTVPLSPLLESVLRQWIEIDHPGGQHTFCHGLAVHRSKKHRSDIEPITRNEVHNHFKAVLRRSKWDKLRGWHVFRHSFCSNCAACGVDQRIINAWVGHQTEEMVKRYRHLIPNQQHEAIQRVFGESKRKDAA